MTNRITLEPIDMYRKFLIPTYEAPTVPYLEFGLIPEKNIDYQEGFGLISSAEFARADQDYVAITTDRNEIIPEYDEILEPYQFTNLGQSSVQAPIKNIRSAPRTANSSAARTATSINFETMPMNSMDTPDSFLLKKMKSAAALLYANLQIEYFNAWSDVHQFRRGKASPVDKTGAQEGVIDHVIVQSIAAPTKENMEAFLLEISTIIENMKSASDLTTVDDYIVHVPDTVVNDLNRLLPYVVDNTLKAGGGSLVPGDKGQSRIYTQFGIKFVGYKKDFLKSSTNPAGRFGYINHADAVNVRYKTVPAVEAMSGGVMRDIYGSSFGERLYQNLNAEAKVYSKDNRAMTILENLEDNKAFPLQFSGNYGLSRNIFKFSLEHLSGYEPGTIALHLSTGVSFIRGTGAEIDSGVNPGMARIIFETGKFRDI